LKELLPYGLLRDVVYHNYKELLMPVFGKFNSENLVREISFHLTNQIYMPGDFIIQKGDIGEEMFFIVEG